MDLITYDPPLPDLPLLRGFPRGREERGPRFDWASYVIRLAQVVAEREGGEPLA